VSIGLHYGIFIFAMAIRLVCAGKFVGDSKCEKLPIEICGAGCTFEVRDIYKIVTLSTCTNCNLNVLQCALWKLTLFGTAFNS
jgi:hypothetical protein